MACRRKPLLHAHSCQSSTRELRYAYALAPVVCVLFLIVAACQVGSWAAVAMSFLLEHQFVIKRSADTEPGGGPVAASWLRASPLGKATALSGIAPREAIVVSGMHPSKHTINDETMLQCCIRCWLRCRRPAVVSCCSLASMPCTL
jgi:hypothetical protein